MREAGYYTTYQGKWHLNSALPEHFKPGDPLQLVGQDNDRIGLGYSWADPADGPLDDQSEIDAFYRVQLTPEIQIGPTFTVIFDPVRNQDEDRIAVWGFRTRVAL